MVIGVSIIVCALGLLIFWPSPGREESPGIPDPAASPGTGFSLRLGHNMPEGSVMDQAARRLAQLLEERSQGRLRVAVFPDQMLGNDHRMVEMARRGELDLILTPSAKLSLAIPEMQYADLPFYFPTPDDLYAMLDGEPGRLLLERMSRVGLVGITFWGNGFKHFTANRPLTGPVDFDALKFRIMKSRLLQQQFEMLGAEAVPIDFHKVRQALLDGVVDGQENPLAAIHSMGIHEVQTDLTLSSHAYLAYVLSASDSSFSLLPTPLQSLLIGTARDLNAWQRAEIERNEAQLLAGIEEGGVHIHHLSDRQREAFRDRLRPLVDRFETVIGPDLIALSDEYIQAHYPSRSRYLIGVDVDLTISSGYAGLEVKRAVQLALERSAGKADSRESLPELIVRNNHGQPSRALRNLQTFADNPKVIGMVGGMEPTILSARLESLDEGMPALVTPGILDSWLVDAEVHPYLFGMGPDSVGLATYIASAVSEGSPGGISLVVENSSWADPFTEALSRQLAKRGRLLSEVHRVSRARDIGITQLNRINAIGGTVVLAVGGSEYATVTDQVAQACPRCDILSVREEVARDNRIACIQAAMRSASYTELVDRYKARYGTAPYLPSLLRQAYDGALLLAQGVSMTDDSSADPVRAQLRSNLEQLPAVDGVIRRYDRAFDTTDHNALDVGDFRHGGQACVMDENAVK